MNRTSQDDDYIYAYFESDDAAEKARRQILALGIPATADMRSSQAYDDEEQREERLSVDKQTVEEGNVRLRKDVVTENQTVDVPVRHAEVYKERARVETEGTVKPKDSVTDRSDR